MKNLTNPAKDGAVQISDEETVLKREKSLSLREEVMHSREDTAIQRDNVVQAREQVAGEREETVFAREIACQKTEATKDELETLIVKLRQANEQLVLSTIKHQMASEEAQTAKDQLDHMAHHDCLTNLPNRALLKERIDQAMALAKRHETKVAVLFIDLDRFKTINDSLGHVVGDKVLTAVGERLLAAVRSTDTVCRQGGDEFVVLLSEITDEQAVGYFADKVCQDLSAPYIVGEQELSIGASIGISLYPDDAQEAEQLIKNADIAMYYGKKRVGGKYHFFKPEMNDNAIERQNVETHMLQALKRQEFVLYTNPRSTWIAD